ncbi:piezo-type mechanosensitive ion channel component 2-like [Hydra vulgaris]|uniref:Piezo-type mechanosensitive ion channel component 2-like n=1 Tax=Hydra vulgaris TaxID=6087 RepID=A0ABM4DN12_HYDVU
MIPEFIICFLFRIVLPISLLAACLVRYNGLSFVYLIYLLIIPLTPSPQRLYYKGAIRLQTLLLLTSTVFIVAQAGFQIVLLSYKPYGHFIKLCTTSGSIAHQIGFDRLDDSKVIDVIRLVVPDVCVFITSLVAYLFSRGFHARYSDEERAVVNKKSTTFIEEYISIISVLLLLFTGIAQPNVLSSVYFLTYIGFGICWAFHISSMKSGLHFFVKTVLTIYSGLHLLLIYLYQLEFFQSILVPDSFSPRLLGLPSIIKNTNCSLSRELLINTSMTWPFYIQPLVLFVLYWFLAVEIRLKYNKKCKIEAKSCWSMCFSSPQTTSLLYNNPMHSLYGTIEDDTIGKGSTSKQTDDTGHGTFKSIMYFFMRQSYVAALIIMMTWSITYHSWLTFVLLLWACISWITPFSHWFCMASSPYLVLYSDVLLVIQYIYGMNLKNELPTKEGSFDLSELGFKARLYPVLDIGLQTLFAGVFLITLRQHISDKKIIQINNDSITSGIVLSSLAKPIMDAIRRRVNISGSVDPVGSNHATEFIKFIKSVFAKYWILVCCTAFLIVALQNNVSLFQILYMVIFLIGFIIYKFSLRAWKIILRPLWWFMVIYSILLLLIIYTYQFENMPQNWAKTTKLNDQWLLDIGLRSLEKPTLFIELLIPTLFSMSIVVQLHFFHTPLVKNINQILNNRKFLKTNKLTAPIASCSTEASTCTRTSTELDKFDEISDNVDKGPKFKKWYDDFTSILWLFAELHMPKIVCFTAMIVAIQQVSAINAVFIIMIGLSMPSKTLQYIISFIMIVWSSLVVLVYMVYQLEFVKENTLERNCTNSSLPVLLQVHHFSSNAWWLGLHKSTSVSLDVRGYLFIVLIIVLEKVVKHHQELHRYQKCLPLSCPDVIFPEITRKMADETIKDCIKYLCNNCFTYFGFEINLMIIAVCMSIRGDVVAVIHSLWLFLFLSMRRKHSAKLWPIYIWFLSIFLVVQYLLILGWPPGLCKGYPWDGFTSRKIVHWLYLTDTSNPQNQFLLLADYFQLYMACCQGNVFRKEFGSRKASLGSNQDLSENYIPADFMANKTWIDFVKILVLDHFLWFTLSIIYITAQTTISLFNSGFLVGCFFFLWHGQGIYLRPRKTMRRWWMILIFYNFFVILSKVWLQLASCVYINWIYQQQNCFLVQLLNLYCLRVHDYKLVDNETTQSCTFVKSNSMTMDCVCFIVIIIQYRIFKCSYFKYVVKEHKKRSEMAYRGAQLVQERLEVHLVQSIQRDEQMMCSIKNKVSKLKNRLAKLNLKAREPLSHYEAIYSGDYYLFEDSDSESETKVNNEEGFEEDLLQCSLLASEPVAMDCSRKEDTSQDDEFNSFLPENIESISVHEEPNESNIVSGSPKEETSSFKKSIVYGFTYIKEVFKTGMNSIKKIMDDSSSDYRSIAAQLTLEMNKHSSTISSKNTLNEEKNAIQQSVTEESSSSLQNENDTWSLLENNKVFSEQVDDSHNYGFMMSFYYALLANSNLLCYTLMIVNHMCYASVLSMPLPFFVFLWGMLSIPRPSKRFWIVIITYVQLVIVVKYIFQFQFPNASFNSCNPPTNNPLCSARIIGIERNSSSVCDLLLLLGLFFHRFALKGHGLWREKLFNDDEDCTPRHKDVASNAENQRFVSSLLDNSMDSENVKKIQDEKSFINRTLIYQKPSLVKSVKQFVLRMLDPDIGAGGVDVYSWIFCTQFMVFVVILSSWSAFSSSNQDSKSNFTKIFEENVVPKTFLYMLLTQFLLMLFDRFLYIRKYAFVKFIYLAILVLLFHIFLFIVVPGITQREFVYNIPAIFLYIFQCMYFGLSAYQVRCGYPTRILVNFLTKNYTITSAILFQGIQAIPFLLELRSVLDWVCTKTTLNLNHWLKMEDIYANTFILKCWRNSEKYYPHPRGLHYWTTSKWLIGGLLVALLIGVIWFPLLFMSFINSSYIYSPPTEATFTLTLGGYQPLFKVTTQQQFLQTLSQDSINAIAKYNYSDNWDNSKVEHGFEDYKMTGNIMSVEVLSNSSSIWTISPPSRAFLINDLKSNSSISLRFQYVFNRESNNTEVTLVQSTVSWVRAISLPPGDPIRNSIAEVIKSGKGEIKIPRLFATFVQVPARGSVKPVDWLGDGSYVDCTIVLRNGSIPDFEGYAAQVEWWEIIQNKPKPMFSHDAGNLEIIVLNDFVPPLHLSFFANTGIIGLYVGFVWLIGKFVRLFFTSISYRIMFDEVPNVDRILKLCLEIYMVRESKELKLEEDLFAKLMFLYRSPETLIKWTKYKRQ